jgi:hypothetical protein
VGASSKHVNHKKSFHEETNIVCIACKHFYSCPEDYAHGVKNFMSEKITSSYINKVRHKVYFFSIVFTNLTSAHLFLKFLKI